MHIPRRYTVGAQWRLMRLTFLATAMLALILSAQVAADDPAKKDFQRLQGAWKVVDAEKDGEPLDRIKGGKLIVKDVNFTINTAIGTEMKGDLRIDPSKKPKHMDFAHQEGLLRDKTWQAIYELDGDDLKICYAEADSKKERPTKFKTSKDSGFLLVVLKREKK